jgi:hypothetical protein
MSEPEDAKMDAMALRAGTYAVWRGREFACLTVPTLGAVRLEWWGTEPPAEGFVRHHSGRWERDVPRGEVSSLEEVKTTANWRGYDVTVDEVRGERALIEQYNWPHPTHHPEVFALDRELWAAWVAVDELSAITQVVTPDPDRQPRPYPRWPVTDLKAGLYATWREWEYPARILADGSVVICSDARVPPDAAFTRDGDGAWSRQVRREECALVDVETVAVWSGRRVRVTDVRGRERTAIVEQVGRPAPQDVKVEACEGGGWRATVDWDELTEIVQTPHKV